MSIKEYFFELNKRMKKYDKNAKNPFLEYNYAYNPFKSAISQTYVWVERENEKNAADSICPTEYFNTSKNIENPLKDEKGGE